MTELYDVKEILRPFYADYAQWLDAGAESLAFNRSTGLCSNLCCYCAMRFCAGAALDELAVTFIAAGLDEDFPFNNCPDDYLFEAENHTCHLNPARVAWVRRCVSNEACL
ncbi:hypothetical protein ACVVJA_002595 [Escherichia coli]|uniref:hypothetical protein n=2 Tax=Escherichia coli TaxID=562 RepID=UPI000FB3565A|nr:hypothetical protein [Escherichia coli]EFH4744264.1 hypothetical protein [Escherichia coli]EFH9533369.1 hypothetical protein [Escherichia coli]EIV3167603.1 hypothetical protein [Escherichia coli]ELA4031369.1 hypothetical protein [Escherichia coli]ELN4796857.1 hypothetical protein [Escherichia coli]